MLMIHFDNIKEYNRFIGYNDPKKDLIDVVKYNDCKSIRLLCDGLTSDFYMMAFKRNMTDLNWFGNTEYDTTSAFLYFIKPKQIHTWNVDKRWEGYQILICPYFSKSTILTLAFFSITLKKPCS